MSDTSTLPTVGEIARRHAVAVHRVQYVIQSRNIKPAARAGNSRVFSDAQVHRIGSELQRIASDKRGGV